MRDFLKDAFEYHHYYNQMILRMLKKHEERISPRSIPLFSHILNAHQIWNSRIMSTKSFGVHEPHDLDDCLKIDENNYQNSLDILSERDLDELISYKLSSGDSGES